MKKIFYILMSAVVALGAVACENAFDDNNLGTNDKVSITVTIGEATKVAISDNGTDVDGKQTYKLSFEEGDQLFVFAGAGKEDGGYYFTYEKTEGEESYVFTCTADGVSEVIGKTWYVYYQGGRKGVTDEGGNPNDLTINGVFMQGYGKIGVGTPITMNMTPVLKFKSDYPVTIQASDWVFNGKNKIVSTGTEECVYISIIRALTFDVTATIKGKPAWVKGENGEEDKATTTITLATKDNIIYNLGELIPEPEEVADGDPAGIAITIDGDFADWNNITKNVVTDASSTMKTVKAYSDGENVYVYAEMKPTSTTVHFGVFLDLDADPTTGGKYNNNGITRYGEAQIQAQCIYAGSIVGYAWGGNYTYNSDGTQIGTFTFTGSTPVRTDDGSMYVELAIPYSNVPELKSANVGIIAYVQDNYATSGMLPIEGSLVIPVHPVVTE